MINLNAEISPAKTLVPLALLIGTVPMLWGVYASLQSVTLSCNNVTLPPNVPAAVYTVVGYLPLLFLCVRIYKRPPRHIILSIVFLIAPALFLALLAAFYMGSMSHFTLECAVGGFTF